MHRRRFFQTTGLAAVAAAGGWRVAPVAAAGHTGSPALAAARRITVGEASITTLSDGFLPIGAEALQGITAEDFAALMRDAFVEGEAHPTGVNAFLIETGGRRVLVDAGTGSAMGPSLGQLPANMEALGLDPASIDTVIATHLHPDHIGGVLAEGGNPFPNAGLRVSAEDLDFWTSEEMKSGAPADFQPFFDMAMGAVAAFGDRVETFSGAADLGDGLSAVPLPGHTVGHSGVRLDSGSASIVIAADIVHVGPVQFPRPEVTIGFDTDPDAARATRMAFLDEVATDRTLIAGSHIGFPGVGHVVRAGDGYRLEPLGWQYG